MALISCTVKCFLDPVQQARTVCGSGVPYLICHQRPDFNSSREREKGQEFPQPLALAAEAGAESEFWSNPH
jgi:hypothetical protein